MATTTNEERPISRTYCTASQILELWRRGSQRLRRSRGRIMLCQDVRRNLLTVQISDDWIGDDPARRAAAEWLEVALPERQMLDLNLGNTLERGEPSYERVPLGETDTALRDADLLEVWANSAREAVVPWEVAIAKAREDGEFGAVLLPEMAAWREGPNYLDDAEKPLPRYDRDAKDRPADHPDYAGRDERRSRKAFDDERQAYLAEHPPFVARIISALDCVPIFETGQGRRRWELSALVVRTLFERETLLERGYRWLGGKDKSEGPLLVQRGYGSELSGRSERVYLYELYACDRGRPFVAYCVGGCGTWQDGGDAGAENDEDSVRVIDLHERYGLTRPTWGYYYGLHHEDDDPDHRGLPFVYPLVPALLNTEGLLTAHLVHTWDNAFTGYIHTPSGDLAKNAPGVLLDAKGNLMRPRVPRSGEIETAVGEVRPFVQARVTDDARYLEQVLMQAVRENAPDERQFGGGGASSGHELVVSHSLLKTAKRQIREGARQCVEDLGEWMLRVACALIHKEGAEVAVQATLERPTDAGEPRRRRQALVLKDRWVGSNYRLKAVFGEEATLADKSLIAQEYAEGRASWDRYCKVWGIASAETERVKIAGDALVRTPEFQQRLMVAWLRRRGEQEAADALELKLSGELSEGGMPTAALAEPPGAMPGGTPGEMPGVAVPNMADQVRGGQVAGEMGIAARQADAAALAQIARPESGGL